MSSRAGLKKVKRQTKTGTRSYWVRAQQVGRSEVLKQAKLESNGNRGPTIGQRILHRLTGLLPGRKQDGALAAMHPGANGGSDHSWFAHVAGTDKRVNTPILERYHREQNSSKARAGTGVAYVNNNVNPRDSRGNIPKTIERSHGVTRANDGFRSQSSYRHQIGFEQDYGTSNVEHVPQNPWKHTRNPY